MAEQYTFQAEIRQLLHILVNALYTEREIFLRELLSNAADALHRAQFALLTAHNTPDADDAPLGIRLVLDEAAGTLTVSDNGIGMARDELAAQLGTIARSGAKAFIEAMAAQPDGARASQNVIGQFGVGFYSVFMVASRVRVVSRGMGQDDAWAWESDGGDSYTISPAERDGRGTDVIVTLNDDAREFLAAHRVRSIVRRHSNYVPFPIVLAKPDDAPDADATPLNDQTAIWRAPASEVSDEEAALFYQGLSMDFSPPLLRVQTRGDSPFEYYALLFVPASAERSPLAPRQQPGLMLYARKVLIQESTTALLPDYLNAFVQGVVDCEDLPLNVSRETVRAERVLAALRRTLTRRVLGDLKRLAEGDPARYRDVWAAHGRFLKQGVTLAPDDREALLPLLRFTTTASAGQDGALFSLDEIVARMAPGQASLYYLLGSAHSPHLGAFRARGVEVILLDDAVDPILLMGLRDAAPHPLVSADDANLDLTGVGTAPEGAPDRADDPDAAPSAAPSPLDADAQGALLSRVAAVLGDAVAGVKVDAAPGDAPARLVRAQAGPAQEMYRVDRLLGRDATAPARTLALNPRHPLVHNLARLLAANPDDPRLDVALHQLHDAALLQEGELPDPAQMAARLHTLLEAATRD